MQRFLTKSYLIRTVLVFVANAMAGLGLALMRLSCMGTDPFSSMNYNASELFGLPLVVFMMGTHALILLFTFRDMKSMIGIGTIINMTIFGLSADFWKPLLLAVLPVRDDYTGFEALPVRVALMVTGILVMIFFLSFYLASDTGMSPYDGLSYVMAQKQSRIPYKFCRVLTDAVCVVVSFILGMINGAPWVVIGVTTLFMAFFTGPLFAFFREKCADPLFAKL